MNGAAVNRDPLFEEMVQALEPFAKAAEKLGIRQDAESDMEPIIYVENGKQSWGINREAFRYARSILQRAREGKSS